MKNAVLVFALICVPLAIAGIVVHSLTSRPQTEIEPEGPFMPSQQPGAVVTAGGYHLSGPYTHGNLAVFLVHGPETLEGRSFLTLQEGLERKQAVVHETGSVAELAVENLSADEELFIQSGDIVKGGKQDRTLPYDSVVGPNSGRVRINSFCVEHGRWTPGA
jgi:ARG and Rhodanese-Phosphatase-superfamily-associated Protein domain